MSDLIKRTNKARRFPTNTCPASRHAARIGEALVRGKPYPMLTEESAHCGESILSAVASLWEARTEIERLTDENGRLRADLLAGRNVVNAGLTIHTLTLERDELRRQLAEAEPMADSDADYWLRNRQPILDAIERAGFMLMSNASGFWLHPRGATDAQAEPKREPLSDERITNGEYVLATKWGDGDPGDHWGVGFYDRFENGRHYVVDSAGKQIRGNGFRRVGRITVDVGRWLLSAGKSLEASPPGTVNLWTMLTERARRIGGSDADR